MRHAVDALTERKFGQGGPFNPETPGYYSDTREVRSRARRHNEEFKACVALQAQHIYERFGKFPGTVPSIFVMPYLQAQHIDLEFYDHFYEKGAYLKTHAKHMNAGTLTCNGKDLKKPFCKFLFDLVFIQSVKTA